MIILRVVGVTFCNEEIGINRQEVIATLSGKEKIYLKREPENRFDKNAIAVVLKREERDFKLGYIKSEVAAVLAEFWNKYKFFANICEIRAGDLEKKIPYGISIEVNYVLRKDMKKKSSN
jgi:hypothetical protein